MLSAALPQVTAPPWSSIRRYERLDEVVRPAADHRHADLVDAAGEGEELEAAAGVVGREPGVQHPGREEIADLTPLEAALEPAARARSQSRAERQSVAQAEPARERRREPGGARRAQPGPEELADQVHLGAQRGDVLEIGVAVAGRQALHRALRVPVGDDCAGRSGAGGHDILGVHVVQAARAQLLAQLAPGRRGEEERVPARERVVAVARLGQLLGRHGAARLRVALEHLDPPSRPGQVRGGNQPVVSASDDDRVDAPAHRGGT